MQGLYKSLFIFFAMTSDPVTQGSECMRQCWSTQLRYMCTAYIHTAIKHANTNNAINVLYVFRIIQFWSANRIACEQD